MCIKNSAKIIFKKVSTGEILGEIKTDFVPVSCNSEKKEESKND
ncbi:hypothetical protein NRS6131_10370 [Bacillus subtilis]|nr:hypothetical protein NRS6131_03860 [Bacillus subtilis]CAI6278909.1 hypothetical protein NRS6131_10370 [Bacillus subtilis]